MTKMLSIKAAAIIAIAAFALMIPMTEERRLRVQGGFDAAR